MGVGRKQVLRRARLIWLQAYLVLVAVYVGKAAEPVPNRIVVLTFDDAAKSHYTFVRPILKKHGFGATFFITEGFDFRTNHDDYMTWEEIAELHRDGFEIGNHTRDHMPVTKENLPKLLEQLEAINRQCRRHGIPRPQSFAYPGNAFELEAISILEKAGIRFARRGTEPERPYRPGRGIAYEIGLDHPLLIPTAGDARPDWTLDDFIAAVRLGEGGRIAVLQFHGVPDRAHEWVSFPPRLFEQCMQYLADHHYTVIALRDLEKYVARETTPKDPTMVIRDRQARIAAGKPLIESPQGESDERLRWWWLNMQRHRFSLAEMVAATGLSEEDLAARIDRWKQQESTRDASSPSRGRLEVWPYPGGRHPRLGFRDGAIRPQRETKVSVFAPWDRNAYVVLDVPEAIWMTRPEGRELLFLAHTHVPTYWDKKHEEVARSEWQADGQGGWKVERRLPNGVRFGTRVRPAGSSVRLTLWLDNGSRETLQGLRVQNCAMLAACPGFVWPAQVRAKASTEAASSPEEMPSGVRLFRPPYAAISDKSRRRWVIFAWERTQRAWGNERVPCLHADPEFPVSKPGQRHELAGWFSFYEGEDIEGELARIDALQWWKERR